MNKMAENEIHVARYYMKRKAYIAALNRAQFMLERVSTNYSPRRSFNYYD